MPYHSKMQHQKLINFFVTEKIISIQYLNSNMIRRLVLLEKAILQEVVSNLENVLKVIQKSTLNGERKDTKLRSRYAEYLVALEFMELGLDVEIRSGFRGSDLIVNRKTRVEIKSGDYDQNGGAFSFGKGTQIAKRQFDYCICVGFDEKGGPETKEILVFEIDELLEIKPRGRNVVRYMSTNPCILIRNYTEEEYLRSMKPGDIYRIELDIIRHSESYLRRWDKITNTV